MYELTICHKSSISTRFGGKLVFPSLLFFFRANLKYGYDGCPIEIFPKEIVLLSGKISLKEIVLLSEIYFPVIEIRFKGTLTTGLDINDNPKGQ